MQPQPQERARRRAVAAVGSRARASHVGRLWVDGEERPREGDKQAAQAAFPCTFALSMLTRHALPS